MEYENKHGLKHTIRGAVRVAMAIAGGAFGENISNPNLLKIPRRILCIGSLPKW